MSAENKTLSDEMVSLEIEKKRLEVEKLKIETDKLKIERKDLQKGWYLKPQWWSVLIPLIIGIGTIIVAFSTGIISVERLKNEKEEISRSVKNLKDSVLFYSNFAQSQKDSLNILVKIEERTIERIRLLSDSLKMVNNGRIELVRQYKKEELNRLNKEIYMYEDHDSIYKRFAEAVDDTYSFAVVKKKLQQLRKMKEEILSQLKTLH